MSKYTRKRLLYLLYSSLENDLSGKEQEELNKGLEANPDLKERKARLQDMHQSLRAGHGKPFAPGFADRVLDQVRMSKSEEENLFDSIIWSFRRLAVIGTAAILILAFSNILSGKEFTLDSLLALPQISLENTLASNSIFTGE